MILPLNYFGKDMAHKEIREELLSVFTIGNVKRGSNWYENSCLPFLHLFTTFTPFKMTHFGYLILTYIHDIGHSD